MATKSKRRAPTDAAPIKVVYSERHPLCGHCVTGYHKSCNVGLFQSGPPDKHPYGAIILCACEEGGCALGRRKCIDCNNRRTDEVDPATWKCYDRDACADAIEAKRAANPLYAQLREAKEKAREMAKTETAAKKAAAAPKVGKCLVTGKPTKGGLFLPGMDARYASDRVSDVMSGTATEAQARKKMVDDGVSEKLIAKFEKNLGIAREKVAKAEAAAKAKAEAKKSTESATKPAASKAGSKGSAATRKAAAAAK